MELFELDRDNDRPLRFSGELIAKTSTKEPSGPRSNRWLELRLYRTARGKLVAQRIGRTIWMNETDRHEAAVCDDNNAVVAFFGLSDAAKEIFHQAKIDVALDVE